MTAWPAYTSNLQKGGALLEVSALLASSWDERLPASENMHAVVAIGAASAVRRADLSARILGRRFVAPGPHVMPALQVLLGSSDHRAFRDACFFEAGRTEPILADFAEGPIFSWHHQGRSGVTVDDALMWLQDAVRRGRAPDWSEAVMVRVCRGLLATLRDFQVLDGAPGGARKHIGHPYPSGAGFAYVCWRLQELGVTAATLERSSVWRRWLLEATDVSTLLSDLSQQGVILLNRAGSVTRIEWQVGSLEEAVRGAN